MTSRRVVCDPDRSSRSNTFVLKMMAMMKRVVVRLMGALIRIDTAHSYFRLASSFFHLISLTNEVALSQMHCESVVPLANFEWWYVRFLFFWKNKDLIFWVRGKRVLGPFKV